MSHDLICYQFSRSKVEREDFSHFLSLYAPDTLPSGRRLRELMNTMIFGIEGYDDDPREIHSIPEVRRFYTAFHRAWPYWLYFCNLETEAFQMTVFSCLRSLVVVKLDDNPKVAVEFDRLELLHFISDDFGHMNAMCERGQMFERLIYDRTKAIFGYFELPFDGGPPPP